MGIFSQKKEIREAKEAAGGIQYAGAAGMEAVSAQNARDMAAEQTQMNVFSMLGAPGTYGPDAASSSSSGNIFDTSGTGLSQQDQNLKGLLTYSKARKGLDAPRQGILDPTNAANAISKTASFRIQSQQVAESEQLLNQKGPAWDMLNNSVIGTINEGAAMQLRDTVRQLKNNAAKGGTARRAALNEANQIIAGEAAVRTRVQETWQANLKLHDYVRQNADRVAAGTGRFMDNLPLMNASYSDAMRKNAALQIEAGKFAAVTQQAAYGISSSVKTAIENFADRADQMILGVTQVVAGAAVSYYSGGLAGGGGLGGAAEAAGDFGGGDAFSESLLSSPANSQSMARQG